MKKLSFLMVLLMSLGLSACNKTSAEFQTDADIIRLNHLEYYGGLLKAYHSKTGTYPFVGQSSVPIYSFVASPQQTDDIVGGPPYAHKVVEFAVLVADLERVLGIEINEYYDPQYEPDAKPNFYIYMVDGQTYNFAVHTHQAYTFGNPVAQGYNKIEITNNTNGAAHLTTPEALFPTEEFKRAKSQNISKPKFFDARESKYLHATKN